MLDRRFRTPEVTTNVSKGAPDYCTVYVIGKGKISSVRSASAAPPPRFPSRNHLQSNSNPAQLAINNVPEPLTDSPSPSSHAINPRYRGNIDTT